VTLSTRANSLWETASRERVTALVDARLLQVLARAYVEVPFYRWFYGQAGVDPRRFRSSDDVRRDLPFVTKADLLAFQDSPEWERLDQREVRQFHLTSGTSGAGREVHLRDQRDLAAFGTGGGYSFVWAGLRPGDRILLTIPYTQTMAGPYFQAACEAAGVVPVNGFTLDSETRIDALGRYGCAAVSITPSHLHRLTVLAQQQGIEPARDLPRFKAVIMSGESYGVGWARSMEAYWGARLHEGWGATQTLGVAMATCARGAVVDGPGGPARGTLHGLDHRCVIEVLDGDEPAPPGGVGEIVITTLRISAMPCLRFRMGDRVRRRAGACPCGATFSTYVAASIGRIDDMMKVRGMNVWPAAVDAAIFESTAVADYRGRLLTDDEGREQMELAVELRPGIASPDELQAALRAAVKARVGITPTVRIVTPGGLAEPILAGTDTFKARRWTDQRLGQTVASA
jgi:phenylacetate-CoA ligase